MITIITTTIIIIITIIIYYELYSYLTLLLC